MAIVDNTTSVICLASLNFFLADYSSWSFGGGELGGQ